MNLPNKITMARIIMIPFFIIALLVNFPFHEPIAVVIFIVASASDAVDGHLARSRNLITDFGKFMDPLADKLLVCSAMICLVDLRLLPSWIVIIIIAREFIISGFRLIAAEHQIVIAASMWGKFKTTFQMAMIILIILNINVDFYIAGIGVVHVLALIATYVALVLTIISLIDYLNKNKAVLKEQD